MTTAFLLLAVFALLLPSLVRRRWPSHQRPPPSPASYYTPAPSALVSVQPLFNILARYSIAVRAFHSTSLH